jgi:hypothetical protein
MNDTFAEYSTSVAFAIQLSKRQCNAMLRMDEAAPDIWHGSNLITLRALEAKGFVWWKRDGEGNLGFQGFTEAGRVMCKLLRLAGLTVANTETAATLRERHAS